ncbi:unnamed protein product [Urochloa humidicola]
MNCWQGAVPSVMGVGVVGSRWRGGHVIVSSISFREHGQGMGPLPLQICSSCLHYPQQSLIRLTFIVDKTCRLLRDFGYVQEL